MELRFDEVTKRDDNAGRKPLGSSAMEFRFDHVGFLTPDVDYSLGVYRALGCELTERTCRRGSHDVAYGGAGTDVLLEFQGPPLLPESTQYLARQPWSIERVALRCDDVEKAYAGLMDAGVASAWAPEPFVIDGGAFDTIDGPVFERRGCCYDHVCFTTGDVAGTWQRAVDRGVEPLSEPAYYPEYDSTIAWLYDAEGTHIELMSPMPAELMVDAHRSGRCVNCWVDGWQRNPAVLPRRGDTALQLRRRDS